MDYKNKYLKYKKKYLSLKKMDQHGGYKRKELKPKSKTTKKDGKDELKIFLESEKGEKIIFKYLDMFDNWADDLLLSSKKLKKITKSVIKKALLKYLKYTKGPDKDEILNTGKWKSYNDTFVKDSIIDIVLKMIN
jgi:hypothetical protein